MSHLISCCIWAPCPWVLELKPSENEYAIKSRWRDEEQELLEPQRSAHFLCMSIDRCKKWWDASKWAVSRLEWFWSVAQVLIYDDDEHLSRCHTEIVHWSLFGNHHTWFLLFAFAVQYYCGLDESHSFWIRYKFLVDCGITNAVRTANWWLRAPEESRKW